VSDEEYVSKQALNDVVRGINSKIDKLKNEIDLLQEKKLNVSEFQQIKQEIAILNEKLSGISSDRKDDQEFMKSLEDKIEKLSASLNEATICNVRISKGQEYEEKAIDQVKIDIINVKDDMKGMRSDIFDIKSSLDNGLGNTLMRLFKSSKPFKLLLYLVIAMFVVILLGAFGFFISHGIPWKEVESMFQNLPSL
jgi:DNA repair exonuclease SbcCD ATPase subunit